MWVNCHGKCEGTGRSGSLMRKQQQFGDSENEMKQLKENEYEEFQQYLYNKAHGYIWTPDTLKFIRGSNENNPARISKQMLEMLGRVRNEHISHKKWNKIRIFLTFS